MRVLFLTHRVPYAPNRGDRARAFHIIRSLASRVELEVVSLAHDADEAAQSATVQKAGVRASAFKVPRWCNRLKAVPQLAGSRALTHMLLDAPGLPSALSRIVAQRPPDVILAYCSGMARFGMLPMLARFPLVIDFVDVDSAKWAALAPEAPWPLSRVYRREARRLSAFERVAAGHARANVVVNQREADLLRDLAPASHIAVVPNGVDLEGLAPPDGPSDASNVLFCGVMDYEPNVEGVLWFARNVWPLVRSARPDARFIIVGSSPVESVRRLAGAGSGITVTGTVPEVRPYLWAGAISVAPLKTARGVQNKVLEALAAGLPTIVTSQVADGLPPNVRAACRVADSAEGFAAAVLALLALGGAARRSIASEADLAGLSWERQLEPLHGILAAAANGPST